MEDERKRVKERVEEPEPDQAWMERILTCQVRQLLSSLVLCGDDAHLKTQQTAVGSKVKAKILKS